MNRRKYSAEDMETGKVQPDVSLTNSVDLENRVAALEKQLAELQSAFDNLMKEYLEK